MPSSESNSAVVLELAEEFLERYRKGERPILKEYIDKRPDLAAQIREVFPAMAMMENIALDDASLSGTPALPAPSLPLLKKLGDYRIIREVGRGGMGVVYEAEQVSLGRHVALKVLPQGAVSEPRTKRRFEREAKAAAKLHHTNIVPVFGVGEDDGMPYYIMQFIQGLGMNEVLAELRRLQGKGPAKPATGELPVSRRDMSAANAAMSLLTGRFDDDGLEKSAGARNDLNLAGEATQSDVGKSSPNPKNYSSKSGSFSASSVVLPGQGENSSKSRKRNYWHSVAQIGVQVASALDYAHHQGILHRDIKPSNLLLDTHGTVWVTDFGLAKTDDQQNLTSTGDILGTLRYMPPEAFEGKADRRGDVYSLGLTLFEMLALRPAYREKDRHLLIKQVTSHDVERLDKLNPAVPRDLVTIIHKATERDPSHRYLSANDLSADLRRFLDDEPIHARRLSTFERFGRWCRRNPNVASLAAGFVAMTLIALGMMYWGMRSANDNRQRELKSFQELEAAHTKTYAANLDLQTAQFKLKKALDESTAFTAKLEKANADLKARVYAADVKVMQDAWEAGNVAAVRHYLEILKPKPGEPDRRGMEWHYFNRLCNKDLKTIRLEEPITTADAVICDDGSRVFSATHPDQILLAGVQIKVIVSDTATGQKVRDLVLAPPLAMGKKESKRKGDFFPGTRTFAFGPWAEGLAPEHQGGAKGKPDPKGNVPGPVVWNVNRDGTRLAFVAGGSLSGGPTLPAHLRVLDVATGKPTFTKELGETRFGKDDQIAISPDGKLVAWHQGPRLPLLMWSVADGKELKVDWKVSSDPKSKEGGISSPLQMTFGPDGTRLAVTKTNPNQLTLLDTTTGKVIFHAVDSGASGPVFSPEGNHLAIIRRQSNVVGYIAMFDALTGEEKKPILAPGVQERLFGPGIHMNAAGLRFSGDGRLLAVFDKANDSKPILVFDVETGDLTRTLRGHSAQVLDVVAGVKDPEYKGQRFLSVSLDGTIKQWDARGTDILRPFQLVGFEKANWMAWNDGNTRFVNHQMYKPGSKGLPKLPGLIGVWDSTAGMMGAYSHPQGGVFYAGLSPDGKHGISLGSISNEEDKGELRIWDPVSRETHYVVPVPPPEIKHHEALEPIEFKYSSETFVRISQDGKRLALIIQGVSPQPTRPTYFMQVRDAETGRVIATAIEEAESTIPVRSMQFAPDGKRIVAIVAGGGLQVWDADTAKVCWRLSPVGTAKFASYFSFSANGKRLVMATSRAIGKEEVKPDNVGPAHVVVIDVDTAELVWKVPTAINSIDPINAVKNSGQALSPDGKWLALYGKSSEKAAVETEIEIWDLDRKKQMEPLAGNLLVQQMAFTADSRRLLVKDGNQVKLWDLASRQLVLSFSPARGATLNSFKLSPDGHRLLLGGIEVVDPTRNQTIFTVLDATPLEEKK